MLRIICFIYLIFFLVACQSLPDYQLRSNGVIKSVGDKREYRYLELPNKLKVLLIHDPAANLAAASMDLHVGSRHDPPQYQGLAHFLEHMLFLGTKKYPEINGYQAFIAGQGGSTNAFTSFEHTNYFFDVKGDALAKALDRFADFFIQPNFSTEYIAREINAVEAEFRSRYSQDNMRIVDATREIVNKNHPYSQFSVGSLASLNAPGLRAALLDFYQRYYSANRMALAVASSHSLDSLEQMVRDRFSAIPGSRDKTAALSETLFSANAGEESALPKILSVQTNKPMRRLVLSFPLPDISRHFQSKPVQYIGHVLGDESRGSLLSILKSENLVESLSTGVGLQYEGGALFQVQLALTEKGINHIPEIINGVFAVLERVRHEQKTAPKQMQRLFEEQRQIAAMAFRFYQSPSLRSLVLHFSSGLHYYPWQSVVAGGYDYTKYNAGLILEFSDYLRAENMLVTLAAQQLPASFKAAKISTHFQAPYGEYPIPIQWLRTWESAKTSMFFDKVSMPKANPFIPNDFTLYQAEEGTSDFKVPQLVTQQPGERLWWQLDNQFEVPKAAFYVSFLTRYPNESARNQMLAAMYIKAVDDQLAEQIYPAYLAGMSYRLHAHSRGLALNLRGYNQSLAPLFTQLVDAMTRVEISEKRMHQLAKVLKRQWLSAQQAKPHRQLGHELARQMLPDAVSYEQLISEIDSVSLIELQNFASTFLQSSYIEILGHGNLRLVDLQALKKIANQLPNCGCDYRAERYQVAERTLQGRHNINRVLEHRDAAALWYFQAPGKSLELEVTSKLLARIVNAEFYNELRTEQQLGYVVGVQFHKLAQIPALSFVLQSPHTPLPVVVESMRQFIADFVERGVPAQAFEQHKMALLADLAKPDRTLFARSNRYWRALSEGEASPKFNRRQLLTRALEGLTFSHWRTQVAQLLDPERASMLITTPGQP